jgi:exopolysaccharide biosynthesis WecB/TagA/CpsF family protein
MSAGGTIATQQTRTAATARKAIFGVAISDLRREEALARLHGAIALKETLKIAFCNAHTANLAWGDAAFRETLRAFTVFADGVGVDVAAKLLHGAPFAANLNGTDFIPELLRTSPRPLRVALFGAKPQVAEKAAAALAAVAPQHAIAAVQHGYVSEEEALLFMDELRRAPVDVLLVALGNPGQEYWISRLVTGEHATLAFGVGALFDFLAGEVHRAPLWIREIRMEWAYRLAQEPQRLFRRYVLGNPLFLARVAAVKLGLRRF